MKGYALNKYIKHLYQRSSHWVDTLGSASFYTVIWGGLVSVAKLYWYCFFGTTVHKEIVHITPWLNLAGVFTTYTTSEWYTQTLGITQLPFLFRLDDVDSMELVKSQNTDLYVPYTKSTLPVDKELFLLAQQRWPSKTMIQFTYHYEDIRSMHLIILTILPYIPCCLANKFTTKLWQDVWYLPIELCYTHGIVYINIAISFN